MRYLTIKDGIVVGVSILAGAVDNPAMIQNDDEAVTVGWLFDGSTFSPPAPAPLRWDALTFKRLFTPAERVAMRAAGKTDPVVEDFLDLLDTTGMMGSSVVADDADLLAGLDYMTAQGLLAPGRKDEILAG